MTGLLCSSFRGNVKQSYDYIKPDYEISSGTTCVDFVIHCFCAGCDTAHTSSSSPPSVASSAGNCDVQMAATVVPQSAEVIVPLIDEVVDTFWECRRYGEKWNISHPPANYFTDAEMAGVTLDIVSQRVHKKLLLDLVAEILSEIYAAEDDQEPSSRRHHQQMRYQHGDWFDVTCVSTRRSMNRDPPTTVDALKPVVEKQVMRQLKVNKNSQNKTAVSSVFKWGATRRKHDSVDILLIHELRDEEPDWTDYSAEEFIVKMQLADSLFELLLSETVRVLRHVTKSQSDAKTAICKTTLH